jgi:ligand-binding sensor domain-containing protein
MKREFFKLQILVMIAFFLFSCNKVPITPSGITLTPASISINIGDSTNLTASVIPSNSRNNLVKWSSSDPLIAEVSSTGVVYSYRVGKITITATTADAGKSASCAVTVTVPRFANWTNYNTTNSGLICNQVYTIAIDSAGNKWFGCLGNVNNTIGGVSKFDGINWTTYLQGTDVYSIVVDSLDNKWFGTSGGGVLKFDGANWTSYTTNNSGIASNSIRSIAIDARGNKWIATWDAGVSKFDDTNWTTYNTTNDLVSNNIRSLAIDKQGNKWFGTWQFGISKYDGINWTTYSSAVATSHTIFSIAVDAHDNKWFGAVGTGYHDGGLSKFDGTSWTTYLGGSDIWAEALDTDGSMWFGTSGGASKFDGTNWTIYNASNSGLSDYTGVNSITIDAQGNKWFGTWAGVSVFYK